MGTFPVFPGDSEGLRQKVAFYPVFASPNYNCELGVLLISSTGKFVCNGEEYDIAGIRELVRKGHLRTSPAEGERVYVTDATSFEAVNVLPTVKESEFLKELDDIIQELNGLPTSSDVCRTAYKSYLQNPSEDNRVRLRAAYERVPSHLDYALLGFDEKDIPIRKAIYGNQGKPPESL